MKGKLPGLFHCLSSADVSAIRTPQKAQNHATKVGVSPILCLFEVRRRRHGSSAEEATNISAYWIGGKSLCVLTYMVTGITKNWFSRRRMIPLAHMLRSTPMARIPNKAGSQPLQVWTLAQVKSGSMPTTFVAFTNLAYSQCRQHRPLLYCREIYLLPREVFG